jgi:hypothetical protein
MKQKPEYVSTMWFDDVEKCVETQPGRNIYNKVVEVATQDVCFTIGRGNDVEERDLFFHIYQKKDSSTSSVFSIRYGWSRYFLNKLAKGFREVMLKGSNTVYTGSIWDGVQPKKEDEGNTYINLEYNLEENVNQLIITLGVRGSIETEGRIHEQDRASSGKGHEKGSYRGH